MIVLDNLLPLREKEGPAAERWEDEGRGAPKGSIGSRQIRQAAFQTNLNPFKRLACHTSDRLAGRTKRGGPESPEK